MKPLDNTIEILEPVIPLTDLSDTGYLKRHPGGAARACLDILKNGSRRLDDTFWIWQLRKQNDYPYFAWSN